jgi:hypothetical protein
LHGALRLRSQRRARHELPERRQLEKFQIQFRLEAQALSASPELAKRAFNGTTIGKGHLAEAKAAINSPAAGARGAFANEVHHDHASHVGSSCGTTDTSERDELLAKIKEKKSE